MRHIEIELRETVKGGTYFYEAMHNGKVIATRTAVRRYYAGLVMRLKEGDTIESRIGEFMSRRKNNDKRPLSIDSCYGRRDLFEKALRDEKHYSCWASTSEETGDYRAGEWVSATPVFAVLKS